MSIKVFLAGDSTAAEKLPEKRPEAGWGEQLQRYLRADVLVRNIAVNGRSTRSYIEQGRLAQIEQELQAGDFLIIQFGHNDQKLTDPERYTEPWGSYQSNLAEFVAAARRKGATPLLVTPVTRRNFADGVLQENTIGDYPQAMRQLAERLQVRLLDLYTATWQYMSSLGDADSVKCYLHLQAGEHPNYPEGKQDNTHFNQYGAERIAELFVKELTNSDCKLKEYLI